MENKENQIHAIDVVCKNLKSNLQWYDNSSENNSLKMFSLGLYNLCATTNASEELNQNWWLN